MDKDKPSKQKRIRRQKNNFSDISLSAQSEELLPISKVEALNIERVFAQALDKYKEELLERKKDSHKELNQLNNMIEEYLSCFALIGFSLDGDKVCIIHAKNARDEGALVDHLRSTFIDFANNRP